MRYSVLCHTQVFCETALDKRLIIPMAFKLAVDFVYGKLFGFMSSIKTN
tara:strand:+ start:121485 stop:121631 length:147 start_codon:yes stop_codon:yes gene_type:complete